MEKINSSLTETYAKDLTAIDWAIDKIEGLNPLSSKFKTTNDFFNQIKAIVKKADAYNLTDLSYLLDEDCFKKYLKVVLFTDDYLISEASKADDRQGIKTDILDMLQGARDCKIEQLNNSIYY